MSSKVTREEVAQFLRMHPELFHRKHQHEIVSQMVGITKEQVERAETISRRIRDIIPADEQSGVREAEWRIANQKDDVFDTIKVINGITYKVVG